MFERLHTRAVAGSAAMSRRVIPDHRAPNRFAPSNRHERGGRPRTSPDAATPAEARSRPSHDFSRVSVHAGARAIHGRPAGGNPVASMASGFPVLQRQPSTFGSPGPVTDAQRRGPADDEACDWPECEDLCEKAARTFFEDEGGATVYMCPGGIEELAGLTVHGCNKFGMGRWVCGGEATIDCGPDWPSTTSRFFVRSLGNDRLIVRNEQLLCEYTLVCVDAEWELWPEDCTFLGFSRWAGRSPRDAGALS